MRQGTKIGLGRRQHDKSERNRADEEHELLPVTGCNGKVRAANPTSSSNDKKHIGEIARRTRERLDHVLVVDNGSTDRTEQCAREAGAEVIVHAQNEGKGEAIKTGLAHWLGVANPSSSGQNRQITWVILLDSDGQHLSEEIDRFLGPQPR